MKVGDLVRHFDDVGVVFRVHGFGRITMLWTCGRKEDFHFENVQLELINESR